MKLGIIKRSIELNGHKTSVSLEDEFWDSLRLIAREKAMALPLLLQTIDAERGAANMSSAIRVFVLGYFREQSPKPAAERDVSAQVAESFRY